MQGEVDIGRVYRSLKRSTVRDRVYNYAYKEKKELSTIEISDVLHIPEKNVVGALIGDGKRYKKEESLVELGVMKSRESCIHGHTFLLVMVTEKGREIFDKNNLKDYSNTIKGPGAKGSPEENGALIKDVEGMKCKEQAL